MDMILKAKNFKTGKINIEIQSRSAAERAINMPLYVYQKTEPGVWSVGYFSQSGDWITESQCINAEEAALHAHWLNIDIKDGESEDIRNNI